MTSSEFIVLFPEFSSAPTALIESRIAWAEARTTVEIWGELREQGVGFLTAHYLALAPGGKAMGKGENAGETMYLEQRRFLEGVVSSGWRVVSSCP